MNTILENLKSYFQENSREQIEKDWAEFDEYDNVGPSVYWFLEQSRLFCEPNKKEPFWGYYCSNQIIENPKFTSDFLFKLVS